MVLWSRRSVCTVRGVGMVGYLKTLRSERPESYEDWVREHLAACERGADGCGVGSCDPLPRRLHHLIRLVVAVVQEACAAAHAMQPLYSSGYFTCTARASHPPVEPPYVPRAHGPRPRKRRSISGTSSNVMASPHGPRLSELTA